MQVLRSSKGKQQRGSPKFPLWSLSLEHSIHSWSSKDKTGCANSSLSSYGSFPVASLPIITYSSYWWISSPFQTGSPSTATGAMRERKQRSQRSSPIARFDSIWCAAFLNGREEWHRVKKAGPLSFTGLEGRKPRVPHLPGRGEPYCWVNSGRTVI